MKSIDKAKTKLMQLNTDLQDKPDDKLIKGYKNANKDYIETNNYQCKVARDLIGNELKRRGIDLDKLIKDE